MYNNKEFCEKITELLTLSESRIDRTNDMVCKCVDVMNKLTNEYTKQIDKLQENRDLLVSQNTELIKMVQKAHDELDILNKRYDSLLEKALHLKTSSENNITVK